MPGFDIEGVPSLRSSNNLSASNVLRYHMSMTQDIVLFTVVWNCCKRWIFRVDSSDPLAQHGVVPWPSAIRTSETCLVGQFSRKHSENTRKKHKQDASWLTIAWNWGFLSVCPSSTEITSPASLWQPVLVAALVCTSHRTAVSFMTTRLLDQLADDD